MFLFYHSIIHNKRNNFFYYNINAFLIIPCNQVLNLDVLLDNALTFTPHIIQVVNTALKTLRFIFRNTREFKNISAYKSLFYSLVLFCFLDAIEPKINLLEKVQHKFAKYLHFKMYEVCFNVPRAGSRYLQCS